MVIATTGPPRSVKLRYIADIPLWEVEKPYAIDQVDASNINGVITNIVFEEHESNCLYDLRGSEDQLDIFKDSFEYVKHPTQLIYLPEEEMMVPYAKEINSLLRKRFNTDRVITYDLRVTFYLSPIKVQLLIHASFERTETIRRTKPCRKAVEFHLLQFRLCMQVCPSARQNKLDAQSLQITQDRAGGTEYHEHSPRKNWLSIDQGIGEHVL